MNEFLKERWVDVTKPVSRIDYILLRPNDPWRVVEIQAIDERIASEHLAYLGGFGMEGGQSAIALESKMVEAAGVEPASENVPLASATCLVST